MKPGERVKLVCDPGIIGEVLSLTPDGVQVRWNWEGQHPVGIHAPDAIAPVVNAGPEELSLSP